MLLTASAASLVIGVAMLFIGVRGRRVSDDPHCRACGFNLRGRPDDSTRCAECGADVTRKRAIRIGARQRRGKVLAFGLLVTLASAGVLGSIGYQRGKSYEWIRLKPIAWLLRDLGAADVAVSRAAWIELRRRIADKSFPQAKVDLITDHALARQADRSRPWDVQMGDLIDRAALAGRLDEERTNRYLTQGIEVKLLAKSKLRRGQAFTIQVTVKQDRLSAISRLRGSWTTSPLEIGDTWLDPGFGNGHRYSLLSSSSASTSDRRDVLASLPEGTYALATTVKIQLITIPNLNVRTTTLTFPLSMPVQVCPRGATVDTFSTDAQLRDAMRAAVPQARVFYRPDSDGRLDVRFKTDAPLPLPIAAEAFIVQGGREQSLGRILMTGDPPSPWRPLYTNEKLSYRGKVDLHLRPSQETADRELALATYWGEPIIFPDVEVDAPYAVPFNNDESLRPAVEAALIPPVIHRGVDSPYPLSYQISYRRVPVKLDYSIIVRSNGNEHWITNWRTEGGSNGSGGSRGSTIDFDPEHHATTVDVIYRPNPNWEIATRDSTPPWGGEIVFRGVKVGEGPITDSLWRSPPTTRPMTTKRPSAAAPGTWTPLPLRLR